MNYKIINFLISMGNINSYRFVIPRRYSQEFVCNYFKKSSMIPISNKKVVNFCSRIRHLFILQTVGIRRIFSLYSDISSRSGWTHLKRISNSDSLPKLFLMGTMGAYMCDSSPELIAMNIIEQFMKEVELIEKLQVDSNTCSKCKDNRSVQSNDPYDIEKCVCSKDFETIFKELDGWDSYLNRDNIIVWRKEEKPAMYSYKVYAEYYDITPNDFLHVQTDLEYRKQWDGTVAALESVEIDHLSDRHIIYWETKWPRLFANRDYVYSRKIYTDKKKKWIVICNQSTKHAKCPEYPDKHRVQNYWSYMIIKPTTGFYEPGLQYVLIYFDDPGLAIPSTVTSWIAQTQMPDFLYKLYIATKKYVKQTH